MPEDGYTIIRGLIVENRDNYIPNTLVSNELYHVKIIIKEDEEIFKKNPTSIKHTKKCYKHGFFKIEDDELTPQNKIKLITNYRKVLENSNLEKKDLAFVEKSIPNVIDSANFICKSCKLIIRLELSTAEFDKEAINNFQLDEIQLRFSRYISALNGKGEEDIAVNEKIPSIEQCFTTVGKVVKGPLQRLPNDEIKSIRADNKSVNIHLGIEFMINYLNFTNNEEMSELFPPNMELPLVKESYIRKYFESIYYSKMSNLTYSGENIILKHLNEAVHFGGNASLDIEDRKLDHSKGYITLSCKNRDYSDENIKEIYKILVTIDPANEMKYFDCLKEVANYRRTTNIMTYIAQLSSEGKIGFDELCEYYKTLQIPLDANVNDISDEILIDQYKLLVSNTTSKSLKDSLRSSFSKLGKIRHSAFIQDYLNSEPLDDLEQAYNNLDISESVDDDVVITAYGIKVDDFPTDTNLYDRSLLSIAINRKSFMLLDYIENNLGHLNYFLPIDYSQAFSYIGCDELANEFQIITIFQERLAKDHSCDVRLLRAYLREIGQTRNSQLILNFLKTGIIDQRYLPVENTPVGLNNIGNTCYLNSLLQYYFVIEPLRSEILKFNEVLTKEAFESNELFSRRRIGGRTVGYKETERSYQFIYQLRDLFEELIKSNERCVSPKKELAYLAFSPSTDEVEFDVSQLDDEDFDEQGLTDKDKQLVLRSNSTVIANSTSSLESSQHSTNTLSVENENVTDEPKLLHEKTERKNTSAICKISTDQMENALEMGRQQDVTECIENVLFQMESAFTPTALDEDNEQIDLIKNLFYGKTKQTLQPIDPETGSPLTSGNVRSKVERFLSLLVNIGDHPKDIYDALDTYFTEDIINLDDGQVKRTLTIAELPKILQIQIQRVQFDRERYMPVKSIDPIPFEEKIYMDRYMETDDDEIIEKRKEVFNWKKEIANLNSVKAKLSEKIDGTQYNAKDSLTVLKNYLESGTLDNFEGISVKPETIATLNALIERIFAKETSLNNELAVLQNNIAQQFTNFNKIGYSIFAIFIHRGEASYGHYWIYIKDPKRNVYRKYNDENVSEVSLKEVFNFDEGNTATPYFLVYVKDDLEDDYVEPLKRDLENIS
ncbi:hypothetical protein PACTADRAFT_42612 [Pachysolen tannophilus NRRL Y-2460]|uniref:Ubiquitin carboxyl-terminal hydrolase 2 n=1 Tax=Pachysolen tannophilus NRRL Y-2460 TaxID=669874 RepID=A0A1E4TTK2_PACTA|nr:hypothetical protein PACTADRAFT_42612 [Pachysolen tannophilus NRRL Y-2460]